MHSINLDAVVKSNYPAVIRMAAQRLKETEYTNAGIFLSGLNDADLTELVEMCESVTNKTKDTKEWDVLDCITLLGEMVAQAEGTPLDNPDLHRAVNMMILITFEDLARKGVIDFYRERATLGADLDKIEVAKLKE